MAPLEREHFTIEKYKQITGTCESFVMSPPPDGSLEVVKQEIHDHLGEVEFTIKQAVRAREVGKPEKPNCGDYAAVFTQKVYSEGEPYATAIVAVNRDFLSLGKEDEEFWHGLVTDPETVKFAKDKGILLTSESLPDEVAATFLRTHTQEYQRVLLGALASGTDEPYETLTLVSSLPQYESLRHSFHNIDDYGPRLDFIIQGIVRIPQNIENREIGLFGPIDKVINYYSEKSKITPSFGLCGDIQTIMLYLKINPTVWSKEHPAWKKPPQDTILVLRSNADQVTRFRPNNETPWTSFAMNNNFLADNLIEGKSAGYKVKPNLYWMTGVNRYCRSNQQNKTPLGLPKYTFEIFPVSRNQKVELQTISDGLVLQPPKLYYPTIFTIEDEDDFHRLMKLSKDTNPAMYKNRLESYVENPGWIFQGSERMIDFPSEMTPGDYKLFLKIRNNLGLQRPDDATFVGLNT